MSPLGFSVLIISNSVHGIDFALLFFSSQKLKIVGMRETTTLTDLFCDLLIFALCALSLSFVRLMVVELRNYRQHMKKFSIIVCIQILEYFVYQECYRHQWKNLGVAARNRNPSG